MAVDKESGVPEDVKGWEAPESEKAIKEEAEKLSSLEEQLNKAKIIFQGEEMTVGELRRRMKEDPTLLEQAKSSDKK